MGRIKLSVPVSSVILISIFLFGCSPVQKKQVSEKAPLKQETQKVMITTGTRILPQSCRPGEIITVKIDVIPANQISGVVVAEKIPEGWKIVSSNPQVARIENNNVHKWLQWGTQVAPFTITYQIKVPEKEKGEYLFEGTVTTYREGELVISGNNRITVK